MFTEEVTTVIMDPGSLSFRAGYSGEETPRTVCPSNVGEILIENNDSQFQQFNNNINININNINNTNNISNNNMNVMTNNNNNNSNNMIGSNNVMNMGENQPVTQVETKKKQYFVGDISLRCRRDNMDVNPSYKNGQIVNKEGFLEVINHIYDYMNTRSQDYFLLMSENFFQSQEQREWLCQIAFEQLQVKNFYLTKSAALSCYSAGRATALVVDSGGYQTSVIPVYDGYCLQKSLFQQDIGGENVTEKILNQIENKLKIQVHPKFELSFSQETSKKDINYLSFPNTKQSYYDFCKLEIAREIKESISKKQEMSEQNNGKIEDKMPDGQIISLDPTWTNYSDFFFTQDKEYKYKQENNITEEGKIDMETNNFKGIHQLVTESVNSCEVDIKKDLYSNIILTGGNSLLYGLSNQLSKRLTDQVSPNYKVKMINYPTQQDRKYSSWIGGSIIASLSSFQTLWIGKLEYEESGSSIVEKKCP